MKKIVFAAVAGFVILLLGTHWFYVRHLSNEALHRKVLLAWLNDPDSAQFKPAINSLRDSTIWCGQVNARNRMGGMTGFTRYVVYLNDEKNIQDPINEVYFEPYDAISEEAKDKSMIFIAKWNIFCRP
jgi:hypothetical protein